MIEWNQRVQKLRRFCVETTQKNPRGELIDISSILKVESTSKFPRQVDVIISTWIRLSKSMKFRRTFHVEFRRRIDDESTKMCPLGLESICSCDQRLKQPTTSSFTVTISILQVIPFFKKLAVLNPTSYRKVKY